MSTQGDAFLWLYVQAGPQGINRSSKGNILVDRFSILSRTEVLRDEITLIQHQEQLYRNAARHSLADKTARAARRLRLWEIRTELGKLRGHEAQ